MQCGLRAVPPGARGVLFTLVDHPNVADATVRALLETGAPLAIPRYQGRRGHPIWFSRDLIAEFLALDIASTARDVVDRHAAEIHYLEVDDPAILDDVDDPEAFRRLTGSHDA
jgi:molybdenum cofactor cytidylyltransferase